MYSTLATRNGLLWELLFADDFSLAITGYYVKNIRGAAEEISTIARGGLE